MLAGKVCSQAWAGEKKRRPRVRRGLLLDVASCLVRGESQADVHMSRHRVAGGVGARDLDTGRELAVPGECRGTAIDSHRHGLALAGSQVDRCRSEYQHRADLTQLDGFRRLHPVDGDLPSLDPAGHVTGARAMSLP